MTFAIDERSGILVLSRRGENPRHPDAGSRSGARSTLVRAAVAVLISTLKTRTVLSLVDRALHRNYWRNRGCISVGIGGLEIQAARCGPR